MERKGCHLRVKCQLEGHLGSGKLQAKEKVAGWAGLGSGTLVLGITNLERQEKERSGDIAHVNKTE